MIKNLIIAIMVSIALPFYTLLLFSLYYGSVEVIIDEEDFDITSLFEVFEADSKIEYDFKDSFMYKEYSE